MKKHVLVFGGSGLVGSRFIELAQDQFEILAPLDSQVNLLDKIQVNQIINDFTGDCVINFAAFTSVAKAEEEKGNKEGLVYKLNALAVKDLAEICQTKHKHLIQFSTEYVFDGKKSISPYTEVDLPNPLNWYGETKFQGDKFIQESGSSFTIVRISMPFSSFYPHKLDIARRFVEMLNQGQKISAITDAWNTPILVDDIAQGLICIVKNKYQGVVHFAPLDQITPYDFALQIARYFKLPQSLVLPTTFAEFSKNRTTLLLKNSWLSSVKFQELFQDKIFHSIEEEVKIFKKQVDSLGML